MIDKATAIELAQQFLAELAKDWRTELTLVGEPLEMSDSYFFHYDSRRHVESRDIRDALFGSLPISVDRRTGEVSDCSPDQAYELRTGRKREDFDAEADPFDPPFGEPRRNKG